LFRPGVEPFLVKWAFFGALDELSIQWVLSRNRDRFNLEQATEQILDMFFGGISTVSEASATLVPDESVGPTDEKDASSSNDNLIRSTDTHA
jgi:hypothetical protein